MATAEKTYADPSALLKLYLNEPESRSMTAWRAKVRGPLSVTHHGRVELINGISLAAYRKLINEHAFNGALAALDDDFEQGRYVQADLLWRTALNRAADLSRQHSRTLGTRSLDVLHIASALELGFRTFITFDTRQQNLVKAVGLKLVVPSKSG
ncbi:MAG TPA: type II toxin-antitoxin system VapC family toxin [Opitutaceae bacterium]|nr:type II toxin-antitoxin system VapC family toxin [Opitutaceae bacterium]